MLGVQSVVLVPPVLPQAEAERAAVYWPVLRDLSRTYQLPLLEVTALQDHQYWQVADQVLGAELNAAGQAALQQRLRNWQTLAQ